jgi:hypothetical protein
MEHVKKFGKSIADKQVKFAKKYFKKTILLFDKKIPYYNELDNSVLKIKNIRKYKHSWGVDYGYVYEIDLIVDFSGNGFNYSYTNERANRRKRLHNSWYREKFQDRLLEELKYFDMSNIVVSKIEYKKID